MHDVTDIDEFVQGSPSNMTVTKNGKLHIKVRQVDESEFEHNLWPLKCCKKEGSYKELSSVMIAKIIFYCILQMI